MFHNLKKNDRTFIFINGSSLYYISKAFYEQLGNSRENDTICFNTFRDYFIERCNLIRPTYYAIYSTEREDDFNPMKRLLDWLVHNGFHTKSKNSPLYEDYKTGRTRPKYNYRVEMALDMVSVAFQGRADHIILFSGENELAPAVEMAKAQGVKVTVVSSKIPENTITGDELSRSADQFVEIYDFFEELEIMRGRRR